MKTKTILFAASMLMAFACAAPKTDLDKYGLNCIVKEVRVTADSLEFPYTALFNELGQITEVSMSNYDGSFRYRESYTYDDKHRVIEIRGVNAENEDEIRYEYEYDGRFMSICRIYGMNNNEMNRWEHENDGRHIVRTVYYNEGEQQYTTTRIFDGNSYKEESVSVEGDVLGRATIQFLTEEKPMRIDGDDIHIEIDYNEKGLPVRSLNILLSSICELHWGNRLDIFPERFYTYEYDKRGNWISRVEKTSPDGEAVAVLRREIVY